MKVVRGFFKGSDGTKLSYAFASNPPAENTLIILHGHGEHIGRYEKFYDRLNLPKFAIASYDFRGHGKSEGPAVFVKSLEEYIEDARLFREHLAQEHGVQGKVIVLGHSFGGLTAVYWAMREPEKMKGLILSSPCLGLRLPGFLIGLNAMLYRIAPRMAYQHPVYPPHLTHNLAEVETYKKDALIQRKITVSLIYQVLSYMRRLEEIQSFAFPFPVFILAAGLEKVVDFRKTRQFFDKVKAPVKDLQVFEGFYHEIFNELKQEEAFRALYDRISKIVGLPPTGAAQ